MNQQPVRFLKPSRPPVGHGTHFMITLFTCGAWLPIWVLMTIIDWCREPRTTGVYVAQPQYGYEPYAHYPQPLQYLRNPSGHDFVVNRPGQASAPQEGVASPEVIPRAQ